MLKFTKESLLKGISKIDSFPELRKGRESIEYDLIFNNKSYPPILVLSEANKSLGGEELLLADFGNSTKKAFKIIKDLGFLIKNKEKEMSKNLILDIVQLCQIMSDGRNDGSITLSTYSEKFKPFLMKFKDKFRDSPNLYLQSELETFYNNHLANLSPNIDCKSFGFWGRSIYNYTWSCIYYKFSKDEIPASYSPQLYILINKDGIKFGFCYGNYIKDDNEMVTSALSSVNFSLLKKCLKEDNDLYFFNSANDEITARPEKLFSKDERVGIISDDDIINNWSHSSLIIKEFNRDNIPENINEVIQNTLLVLKDFYLSLLPIKKNNKVVSQERKNINQIPFNVNSIKSNIKTSNFQITDNLITRIVCSLLTKPFVILTGLSGSGKTKLAQAFALWICENENQYCIVPVGADWTNREPLLGFPNALKDNDYKKDEYGVLKLIIEANNDSRKPYFLILDEMNLSHVERYFADFLSVMESKSNISLHTGTRDWNDIPSKIGVPKNLFIIGTVNIDETTYMFSPKVLDRANVIEFRVSADEMNSYLESNSNLNLEDLEGLGTTMADSFVEIAMDDTLEAKDIDELNKSLMNFFSELKKTGAEFGYRSASEILRFTAVVNKIESTWSISEIIDVAIMQKLLPKLHGSRNKLCRVLATLAKFCIKNGVDDYREKDTEFIKDYFVINREIDLAKADKILYPISFEKIARMYKNAIDNGFTSYAEA